MWRTVLSKPMRKQLKQRKKSSEMPGDNNKGLKFLPYIKEKESIRKTLVIKEIGENSDSLFLVSSIFFV